ncbi:hypothetical protein AV540_12875 [Brevibacillus parabrevis]|uniref:hypothetical protein n=1 Tax=Brevibacillus parabrevis TaxID=54914 RepID=UPI0007AB9BA1|nr:hypothetical protein [Brevibacillus parabrevis]KZE51754.1 hypothetical protein AV540_12875 [Brevibacillus parabrevis]
MRLAVTVKSIGKRKNALSRIPVELLPSPRTLRELIAGLVEWNIRGLLEKQQQVALVPYLTAEEVQEQAEIGKVGFGAVYNDGVPDVQQAVDTAILAFEDGLYRVFVREQEIIALDESLVLNEDDEIVLIRFTMLAGRLW